MPTYDYYQTLLKPPFAPPPTVFGPVWTVLYILIAISFGQVFWMAYKKQIPWKTTAPFFLNLLFNALFTPIQFGLKNNLLASVDILLVLATLIWAMVTIRKHKPWVSYLQIPYLLWVSFATILQLSVTYLNWTA